MNIKKNFFIALVIFAFSAVSFGQTERTRAQFSLYGLHFLGAGQSARLTALNPRFSDSEIIPCVRVRVVFDVYEPNPAEAGRLRFARRVSRQILLDGGEAATFDFTATSRGGEYVSTAVFFSPEGENTGDGSVRLVSTLVLREGGRAILNLPIVKKGFDPQPDPPAALQEQ